PVRALGVRSIHARSGSDGGTRRSKTRPNLRERSRGASSSRSSPHSTGAERAPAAPSASPHKVPSQCEANSGSLQWRSSSVLNTGCTRVAELFLGPNDGLLGGGPSWPHADNLRAA